MSEAVSCPHHKVSASTEDLGRNPTVRAAAGLGVQHVTERSRTGVSILLVFRRTRDRELVRHLLF